MNRNYISENELDESISGSKTTYLISSIVCINTFFNSSKLKFVTISSIYNISSGLAIIICILGSLHA